MNNKLILRWITGGLLVWGLSACSTIKSWFPDKERDYQFTSEIPELIVPDDLKNKGLASLTAQPAETADVETGSGSRYPAEVETSNDSQSAQTQANSGSAETEQVKKPDENQVETSGQPVAANGVSSLQIDQPKIQAVRMVGRALSRQKLEVVERNIEKGYFYVKFDPNAVKAKDESLWDEINFLFGDDPSQEQEYRIRVQQMEPQMSQVTVQDSLGKSLSDPAANALLKLITDGINQVVNQDAASQPTPEPEPGSEQKPAENPVTQQ